MVLVGFVWSFFVVVCLFLFTRALIFLLELAQSHDNSSSCGVPAGAPFSIPYRFIYDTALAPVLAETTLFLGHSH